MNVKDLTPKAVFGYFEEICGIPHPSKHEEKIGAWLRQFGENEIEQNQANERLLKASQQPYVMAIETSDGCFYWDWDSNMQRDSFADFNHNIH